MPLSTRVVTAALLTSALLTASGCASVRVPGMVDELVGRGRHAPAPEPVVSTGLESSLDGGRVAHFPTA